MSKRARTAGACRSGQLAYADSLRRDVGPLRRRFVDRTTLLERAGLAAPVACRDVAVGGHAERADRDPENHDERTERLPARQRKVFLLDRGRYRRRRL